MMKKLKKIVVYIMRHLLIKLLLISVAIAQIPKEDFQDWNVIQDEDIWIGYSWGNYPWCKSNIILQNSADEILSIIEDVDNYKDIFDSVIYSKKHDDNLVHIALTMPFPFIQRDYVVKFEKKKIDKDIVYGFKSYSSAIKPVNDFIRLENAQGEWSGQLQPGRPA